MSEFYSLDFSESDERAYGTIAEYIVPSRVEVAERIEEGMEQFMADDSLPNKDIIIYEIFRSSSSAGFYDELSGDGIYSREIAKTLRHPGLTPIFSEMLTDPITHQYSLGIIFSYLTLDEVSRGEHTPFSPQPIPTELYQNVSEPKYLCSHAEERLYSSIATEAVMVLHTDDIPHFLLKFIGKPAALCVNDIVTPSGSVYMRGSWYAPDILGKAYTHYAEQFDGGQGTAELQEGFWTYLRTLKGGSAEDLLTRAVTTAYTVPEVYEEGIKTRSGQLYPRDIFRRDHLEHYYRS